MNTKMLVMESCTNGEWKDDKANGQGTFVDSNGAMYEGQWVDDQQHGHGKETWGEQGGQTATYTGQFYKGKKNGKGRF